MRGANKFELGDRVVFVGSEECKEIYFNSIESSRRIYRYFNTIKYGVVSRIDNDECATLQYLVKFAFSSDIFNMVGMFREEGVHHSSFWVTEDSIEKEKVNGDEEG